MAPHTDEDAGAQAERAERVLDHARCHHARADDLAVGIGRRDVGDTLHRGDDGLLERGLRVVGIVDEAKVRVASM